MKIFNLTLLTLALAVSPALADTQQAGGMITLTTPQPFSTTLGFVQRLTIRAVPGYCGKIYIGTSAMNTSTYVGVIKVIYPNCYGGLSDEYTIQDVTGANGVDTSKLYIQGDSYGDYYLWDTNVTSVTPVKFLQLAYVPGPLMAGSSIAVAGTSVIQVNVVPGQLGKIHIKRLYEMKVLYPNNGTVTGNITDKYEFYAANANGITRYDLTAVPDVSGEFPLVAVWQYQ